MKKLILCLTSIFILLGLAFVYADVNRIILDYPADAMINNTDNDTLGFEFIYQGDSTTASCSLVMNLTSGYHNITFTNTTTAKNDVHTFYSNNSFSDTYYQWYINCTATGQDPYKSAVRTLTIDTTIPTIEITEPSNSETITTSTVDFNMTASETCTNGAYVDYAGTNVTMTHEGSNVYSYTASGIADNNTGITPTFWCIDQVNLIRSNNTHTFYKDVAPTDIVFVTPSPDDAAYTTNNYTYINITFTETYPANCTIVWDNGTATTYFMTRSGNNCYKNMTGQTEQESTYNITVNDTAGNSLSTSDRTITFDYTDPTLGTYVNQNNTGLAEMTISANVTMTDTNKDSCYARVFSSDGSTTDVTATLTGAVCQATITNSHINADGQFHIEWHGQDSAGSTVTGTNQSNYTMNTLKTGWNMVSNLINLTTYQTGQLSTRITHVSWYNNTAKSYVNYVVGLNTNNDTSIPDGDSAYVYVSSDTYLLRWWSSDRASPYNVTLTKPLNQLTAFNQTGNTLAQLCDETISNSSSSITYIVYLNATDQRYRPHRCGFTYGGYNNITIPRGMSYWAIVDGETNIERYRD